MAHVGLLEDNVRIANMCTALLHFAGHQVVVYEHPRACLQALLAEHQASADASAVQEAARKNGLPVDVLILDLVLPDIDGLEVLRNLTTHPYTCTLPLILCTAATRNEVMSALRIAPHARVVEKPFRMQTLVSAIDFALSSRIRA